MVWNPGGLGFLSKTCLDTLQQGIQSLSALQYQACSPKKIAQPYFCNKKGKKSASSHSLELKQRFNQDLSSLIVDKTEFDEWSKIFDRKRCFCYPMLQRISGKMHHSRFFKSIFNLENSFLFLLLKNPGFLIFCAPSFWTWKKERRRVYLLY